MEVRGVTLASFFPEEASYFKAVSESLQVSPTLERSGDSLEEVRNLKFAL